MLLVALFLACGDKDGGPIGGDDTGTAVACPEAAAEADGTWWGRVGAFYPEGHPEYGDYDIQDAIYVFSADYQTTLCTGSSYGKVVQELSCEGCIDAARFAFLPFDTGYGDCDTYGLPQGHQEPDFSYGRAASLTWQGEVLTDVLLGYHEGLGRWCPIGTWQEVTLQWQGEDYEAVEYSTVPGQPAW